MTAMAAPRVDTNIASDSEYYIPDSSAISGNLDLTAIAGKPNHAPQLVLLINTGAATASINVTAEKNSNVRLVAVPAGQIIKVPTPIITLAKNSTDVVAVWAFWWAKSGCQFNRGNPA